MPSTATTTEECTCILGPVNLQKNNPRWMGAHIATNNTAELCGIQAGIEQALKTANKNTLVRIRTDSALCMRLLIGRRSKKYTKKESDSNATYTNCKEKLKTINNELIIRTRESLKKLIDKIGYGNVHLEKVKGHSTDKWNSIADLLAGLGKKGQTNPHTKRIADALRHALEAMPPSGVT